MNNIKVNQKLEKRFSVKILSNKVRKHFPNWVYEIILKIRNADTKKILLTSGSNFLVYTKSKSRMI